MPLYILYPEYSIANTFIFIKKWVLVAGFVRNWVDYDRVWCLLLKSGNISLDSDCQRENLNISKEYISIFPTIKIEKFLL